MAQATAKIVWPSGKPAGRLSLLSPLLSPSSKEPYTMYRQVSLLFFSCALFSLTSLCLAAPPKAKRHAPVPNQSKGQKQIAGGDAAFGTVYSLKDGFNFEVLSARYTVEPLIAHVSCTAEENQKLVVLDVAVKNAGPSDNSFSADAYFTLVDAQGELYTTRNTDMILASKIENEERYTLRPGQGLGQPARHDPLRLGVVVPAKARIVKIMVNQGRLNSGEKVLRYFVAGATEAEAGKAGDPRNVIAPLPDNVRDPSDPTGATALGSGKGAAGVFLPSGHFALRLDSLSYDTGALPNREAPEDGKKYAVATITVKSLIAATQTMNDFTAGDPAPCSITDSDGETDKDVAFLKAKSREKPEHDFKQGEEYTFRVVFPPAKDATAKTLLLRAEASRTWTFPITAALEGNG